MLGTCGLPKTVRADEIVCSSLKHQ